jgi:hypothetical protein
VRAIAALARELPHATFRTRLAATRYRLLLLVVVAVVVVVVVVIDD